MTAAQQPLKNERFIELFPLQEFVIQWIQSRASEGIQNLQNGKRTAELSGFSHLTELHKSIEGKNFNVQ